MSRGEEMERLSQEYGTALAEYLHGAGETALARAYDLGRRAAAGGLGLLDLAMIHHEALLRAAAASQGERPPLGSATQFLIESLSPYEMTLRSYQANARLLGLAETLEQHNAEIDRSREQLRTILDATTAVIYLKDDQGRYLFVNRQFEEVFGLRRDDVVGRTETDVLPPAVARTLQADDVGVLQARAPLQLEEHLPAADGLHTYLSLKFPLLDADGTLHGICCVATDITERLRADEARQRARESAERERQLEEAVRVRDQFLGIASHELRTPLTSLGLQVETLRRLTRTHPDAPVSDERVQSKCEAILRQVERMAVLVNELLEVGRVASGRLSLSRERADLAEIVRDVVARARDPIRRSGSEVVLELGTPAVGSWDRSRLESIVASLLSNAVKFGDGKPIAIAVRATADRAILTVRDHGMGIAEEDQRRIFDRFERAVSARHFGGFGVGLWVARQAVEAHGGRIHVTSRAGHGSEFSVELPLEDRPPAGGGARP